MPDNPVHHIELWTHDLAEAEPSFDWLLPRLGFAITRDGEWAKGRTWIHPSGAYVVVEQSPAVTGTCHERLRPGLNHLAFRVAHRELLDEVRDHAEQHGWVELFADRYPHAGGAGHAALFLENCQGFEVEIVAEQRQPALVVLAGLPGTGKTTLARRLSTATGAMHLRVDAIETALQRSGVDVVVEGYAVAHEVAAGNLRLGHDVVVDAVNPLAIARAPWADTAAGAGARLVLVEVMLADAGEHRRRVERRVADLPGQRVPTWGEVRAMTYEPWDESRDGVRLVVDGADLDAAVSAAVASIRC